MLRAGFTHVSDDDYARVVIAQLFAHTPKLDPSGTSWLPAPFWWMGGAMLALGRSLRIARALSVTAGALVVALPYAALRAAGVRRAPALAAVGIGMALPWSAWLGAATVPEGWTGALVGAAILSMNSERARPYAAAALLVGSLSRYEAWAACAAFALACVVRPSAGRAARDRWLAAIVVAGPLAWMAWNAASHGSPLHFMARVSAFRRASGAGAIPVTDKLLGYPRALANDTPEVAFFALVGVAALGSPPFRRRWLASVAAAAAILVFLIVGDVGDGAPTHHPSRALSPLWWVALGVGIDALASGREAWLAAFAPRGRVARAGRWVGTAAAGAAAFAWCASLPARWTEFPGRGESERRDAQIARGLDLRAHDVQSATVTPCAFEHFALLAAWGAPERARINPSLRAAPTPECPRLSQP